MPTLARMDIALVTLTAVTTVALLRDPIVGSGPGLTFSRDLMWWNRSGSFDRTERAAFIVDRGGGLLECVLWPGTQEHERATFRGEMPPGTVAIIHTHPIHVPMPSKEDEEAAQRLGIAIYALTPNSITRASPSGGGSVFVRKGQWVDPPPRIHHCRSAS